MNNRFARYSLGGGLNSAEIHAMYAEALKVLEEVGVECRHEGTLARLAEFEGVGVETDRVRFEQTFMDRLVNESREVRMAESDEPRPDHFGLGGPYTSPYILDGDSDNPRRPTMADLRDAVKLCDAMDVKRDCAPLIPADVPPGLQQLAMLKACAENSATYGGLAKGVSSIEQAELICELGAASGRKPPYFHLQFFISPLKYDDALLDIAHHFLDRGQAHMIRMEGGPMPSAGATAPLFIPGIFVQAIAETLAAEALSALLFREHEGGRFSPNVPGWPFDMRYATFVYGSPEDLLFGLARADINRELFGYTRLGGRLSTTSHSVDEQAAAERAFSVIISALAGADTFGGGGMMSLDETFSPEQLVIDREIVDWAERFMRGLEVFGNEGLSFEVISEIGPGGNYFMHPTTVDNFRRMYWQPALFEHMGLGQWRQKGSQSLRRRAGEIVKEKVAAHQFQLDADVQKEMNKVYEKAAHRLG